MNGYKLTQKMRKTRTWYKLTPYAQLLYYELVAVCNEKRWEEVFQCSNTCLCRALNTTEKTLLKARKELVRSGLVFYQSGQQDYKENAYSFTIPFKNKTNAPVPDTPPVSAPAHQPVPAPVVQPVPAPDVTTVPDPDNIKQVIYIKQPPLSPRESEHFKDPLFISFDNIKNSLLADVSWKEQTAMISGLSVAFLAILPAQIDIFLQYLIATGEENTVKTLSDAKRRFFFWWKNYGKKAYEELHPTRQIVVW